ncbi:alpha/beta-Hydrolases superfamily protein [Striga hermonthica]|uniref:Alpha/beta-Hydrolases superfamily protein n=1 Tax=Striga hermonthica TaxID=68872 RepID=A0A9N7NTU3_STRHE|nr:alpha/beta-Hydrolases superfamily protein [Striga hermonthica]
MAALRATPLLLAPLHNLRIIASTHSRPLSPFPVPPKSGIKFICLHSPSCSAAKTTPMEATAAAVAASDGQHRSGDWFSVPELRLRDHRFVVPLDYSLDVCTSPNITVFAREVVAVGREEVDLPFLLYLQGGPGFECARPTDASGWIKKACEDYRVVLMDQRGTGLSTPLTSSSMSQFESAEKLVDYLKHFRADNIVNDAEFIRKRLVPGSRPWTVLGQSYGGFCAVTYLSFAPQGLKQVLLTGGIPPIGSGCTADAVYRACFEQVMIQNEKYYKRFPRDIETVREVVKYLADAEGGGVPLPSGGILTPRGLQLLGLSGLGSSTGFERLHYMFERVWDPILVPGAPKKISYTFLNAYERWLDFDTNPLYALMHESIYCQDAASSWSAHRIRSEYDNKFDAVKAVNEGAPVLFTGEVPVAAAVYYEDVYVNFNLVKETAAQIEGIQLWITNEYMHSGLRDSGTQVLDHLLGMLNGKKPLF